MQQKEVILEGTIKAFNEKGLKFTMDDVAKILGMSKKTIYTVFRDKESMFLAMVDYMFDSIKESEQQIVEDDALSTVDDQTSAAAEFSFFFHSLLKAHPTAVITVNICFCKKQSFVKTAGTEVTSNLIAA